MEMQLTHYRAVRLQIHAQGWRSLNDEEHRVLIWPHSAASNINRGQRFGMLGLLSARHICIFLIEVDGYSVPFHAGLLARWKALQGIMLAGHLDKWEAPVGLIGGATVHSGKELCAYTHKVLVPPCVPNFFSPFLEVSMLQI